MAQTHSKDTYSIGIVADMADCQVQTIRYYENIGIIGPNAVQGAGVYTQTTISTAYNSSATPVIWDFP